MSEVYCLDTNFILSYFVRNDENHKPAQDGFKNLPNTAYIIVPILVLGELSIKQETIKLVDGVKILADEIIVSTLADMDRIYAMDPKVRGSLKVVDCFILAMCQRFKAELLTFDKKLYKAHQTIS